MLNEYNKVLAIDKNSEQAYLMRGVIYEVLGEYRKAISDWQKIKKIPSANPENIEHANRLIEGVSKKRKE